MNTSEKMEIINICKDTFDFFKCSELFEECDIKFSNRMTKCMGVAKCTTKKEPNTASNLSITFSVPLLNRANKNEKKETTIHEVCHIISIYFFGRSGKGHGIHWKNLMNKIGIENPERCHKIECDDLKRTQKRYKAHCDCQTFELSGRRRSYMIKRGYVYRCTKCKSYIELDD